MIILGVCFMKKPKMKPKSRSNQKGGTLVEYSLILALVAIAGISGMSDISGGVFDAFDNASCGALGGTYQSHEPNVPAFGFYSFEWAWQNEDGSGCLISMSWSMDPPPPSGGGK